MFFYKNALPVKGTIVVANIDVDEETETCIYVSLIEYNNFRGIIYKSELPKRAKIHKKTITDLKHQSMIVCTVSNNPKFDKEGIPELIELTTKGVATEHHANVITRFKNLEKIIKIVKFISMEFNIDYKELVSKLHETIITPVLSNVLDIGFDDDENNNKIRFDNYAVFYDECLRNPEKLLELIDVSADMKDQILIRLKKMIKETDATSTLEFDMAVWKTSDGCDPIYKMRSLFDHIKKSFDKIDLGYMGAPRYVVTLLAIDFEKIDDLYQKINDCMMNWMISNNVTGFDIKFDITNKKDKRGEVSIAYPYQIVMN